MSIEFTLLANRLYIKLPLGLFGWLGWLLLLGVIVFLLLHWREHNRRLTGLQWGLFFVTILLTPLASLFIILRLPAGEALPLPWIIEETRGPALVIFAAFPWLLAAGVLGMLPAALIGLVSGITLALGDTHSPFTPLEITLLAILVSAMVRQRYRTPVFKLLRHPLVAAVLAALIYPLIYIFGAACMADGDLAIRLDYAITHFVANSAAVGGMLLVAGAIAETVAMAFPAAWSGSGTLQPSPVERSLSTRFLYSLAPLAVILVVSLTVADWVVAGNAARRMLRDRMSSTAQSAVENVPFFIESGQNLIHQFAADDRLRNASISKVDLLSEMLRTVPFFRQLFLLDANGNEMARYRTTGGSVISSEEEAAGQETVLAGSPRYYSIPPEGDEPSAQVSFWYPIEDETGIIQGALVGRTDLKSNPFTKPILASLDSLVGSDGEGLLLDDKGRILYSSSSVALMQSYSGKKVEDEGFYDDTAPDGTRRLVYYQRTIGNTWAVVLAVPARRAQQLALTIAAPLLVMIAVLFVIAMGLVRLSLKGVTSSLGHLALASKRISGGQLDTPLPVEGEDEVGQLRRSFEQMRVSLKARMDELNRLLLASQGVASSLEVDEAVKPVLEAALAMGGSAARVVLEPATMPEVDGDKTGFVRFGVGAGSDIYSGLDEQVLALTRQQDRVVLTNLSRTHLITLSPGMPRVESIIALALRHENFNYGALWVAYDTPHPFGDDEIRFMVTLAGQAALAAANARLFLNAEIGRQRLAAILASTPDPVLVTDQRNRLLLANPAAWQATRWGAEVGEGRPVDAIIPQKELVKLMCLSSDDATQSVEVTMADGRVYLATASSVMADGQRVGRVCVLRDVTHFKELDALKSEFVSTVSHDLRSPLTLMRGYATMLEMVGNLNDQQVGYVRKIVTGVETMSKLVNNLLDLGRIEAGVDLQLEMVPVQDVVDRVIGALQLQATQKRIQLTMEMSPQTVPLVEADQSLLQQALHNLLDNAIKYTDSGGKVGLRVYARQDRLVFEVSDTGIGIAPVDLPRLFEKFFRAGQKEAQKRHGTGLGLAIVKSIAERHGGQVWAESQLGKGSTFYLSIPQHQPKKEPVKTASEKGKG
jgi:PAS domain S-box-containing protein